MYMDQVLCIFSINWTNPQLFGGGMLEPGAPLPLSSFSLMLRHTGLWAWDLLHPTGLGNELLWQQQADTAEKFVDLNIVFVGSHDLLRRLSHQNPQMAHNT